MSLKKRLDIQVSRILRQKWNIRKGISVPSTESVVLSGGGVDLDATVLYADLAQSSMLATLFQRRTASKVMRCFLFCASRIIRVKAGRITSFDGDRIMGIFIGKSKETRAVTCAFQINYIVENILQPKIEEYFQSFQETKFYIDHAVGIDNSKILAVRAGQRGANDLIWIGRAPNLAAKLSDVREKEYSTYITKEVFDNLSYELQYNGIPFQSIWERRYYTWLDEKIDIYRSGWCLEP